MTDEFQTLWLRLTRELDGVGNPAECCALYRDIAGRWGAAKICSVVRARWKRLGDAARTNICYAAFDPDAMTPDFAIELFHRPDSTTHNRHLLAAGLALNATTPEEIAELQRLVAEIGCYEESHRQTILDRFVSSVGKIGVRKHRAKHAAHS